MNDLEWPWVAISCQNSFSASTLLQNRSSFGAHCTNSNGDRPILSYYQRQKFRPVTLVFGNIRFMWIFAGVPLSGGIKRDWGLSSVDEGNFWQFRWLRLQKLQRCGKQYYITICYPLSTGDWLQNEWPWLLEWLFHDKIRFRPTILESERLNVKKTCNLCDSVVFCALHDQLASLGRHAQLTRCFSAVAELLVFINGTLLVEGW